jgi:hypothetical protein
MELAKMHIYTPESYKIGKGIATNTHLDPADRYLGNAKWRPIDRGQF